VKNILVAVLPGTTLQGATLFTDAPWWAVVLVVLATLVTCLASLHMSYKQVRTLASLDGTESVEGPWHRWRALCDPKNPESKEPKARGPRRWSQRE
jgi:hypothetical protein